MRRILVLITLFLPYPTLAHGLFDNVPEGEHADPVGVLFMLVLVIGFVLFIKLISRKKR